MSANTSNSESNSTGPQFQTPYVTLMLYPGTFGSLFFERANVGKFLDRFENMCDDYRMSTLEKICRLSWYCEIFTAWQVRSVISF